MLLGLSSRDRTEGAAAQGLPAPQTREGRATGGDAQGDGGLGRGWWVVVVVGGDGGVGWWWIFGPGQI